MPWGYNITAGPTWFLGWLLLFNIAYTTIEMEPVKMKRPSFGVLLGLGMLCGMVQLGALAAYPPPSPWQPSRPSATIAGTWSCLPHLWETC